MNLMIYSRSQALRTLNGSDEDTNEGNAQLQLRIIAEMDDLEGGPFIPLILGDQQHKVLKEAIAADPEGSDPFVDFAEC